MDKDPEDGQEPDSSETGGDSARSPRRKLGEVDSSFYIIGVGASAGGLDAIKQLISQVPEGFPHSFVIIQHLSPDYKSLMSEILGRETSLKCIEIEDNMKVEPSRVYLTPPRSNVVIQGTGDDTNPPMEKEDKGYGAVLFLSPLYMTRHNPIIFPYDDLRILSSRL